MTNKDTKLRPMIVEWVDAKFNPSPHTEREFEAFNPLTMLSCGFGVEHEHGVTLCTDKYYVEGDELNLRYIHVIPRECIKRVTVLRNK